MMAHTPTPASATALASEPTLPPRQHVADSFTYTLKSLEESEITSWASFCATTFQYKANPPPASYFERHYWNDPDRKASYIRVAVLEDDGTIVASCRVFLRRIYVENEAVFAGGIGEVCTCPNHRKRGLAKELLADAISLMKQQQKDGQTMKLSLLHAAPSFFPVYERVGYVGTATHWTVAPITIASLAKYESDAVIVTEEEASPSSIVRRACFPDDSEQLMQLYDKLYRRFAGCIVRSRPYWETYLSREWNEALLVLQEKGDATSTIQGWLCARLRVTSSENGNTSTRVQLCDFGYANEKDAAPVFALLFQKACQDLFLNSLSPPTSSSIDLVLPTVAADAIRASDIRDAATSRFVDWSHSTTEVDYGWMYKALDTDCSEDFLDTLKTQTHLIWPADSF